MTTEEQRSALATAVSAVDGVTGYPYPPAQPSPGDAWPQLVEIDPKDFASAQWAVVLALGTDPGDAARALDAQWQAVRDALDDVMPLTSIRPGVFRVAGSSVLAAEFVGRLSL